MKTQNISIKLTRLFFGFLISLSLIACSSDKKEVVSLACSDNGLPGSLSADLGAYLATNKIIGLSIYMHHPDHGEFATAFGLSDKENNVSASVDTRFGSASFGKAITVAAALKLVDKGDLSLEDNVKAHYPSMADSSGGPAKLWQLMNHTSLVDDSFSGAYSTLQGNPETDTDYEDHITEALGFGYISGTLGDTYSYSTANTNLVGYTMAQVKEKSWQQVVQDEVLTPNGLSNIFFFEHSTDQANRSKFYPNYDSDNDQTEVPYSAALMKYGGAGGTLYGTACDYGRFAKLFFSDEMHSSALASEQASKQRLYGTSSVHYAQLGRFFYNGESESSLDIYFHEGGGVGFSTYGAHVKTTGWTFFYAFNTTNSGTNTDEINNLIGAAVSSL